MKKIVWKKPDGRIAITTPNKAGLLNGETEEQYLDRVAARAQETVPYLADAVRVANIPPEAHDNMDLTFHDAWTWTTPDPVIDIDMSKAREIHKSHLRLIRKPKLELLDIEYLRAVESNDKMAQTMIADKKQALRDVTDHPSIRAAKTAEELKAIIPEILK